ncbi:MAG TPA: hypothetical protein VFL57_13095 [Bryobacteraceae bacterium]|nr:hypothetical protein [Bryobacteraceae bacterium]
MKLCPAGSDEDGYARMVVSYWDTVALFITSGVLNRELFFESGREMLVVWLRLEKAVPAVRAALRNPHAFGDLEQVGHAFVEWLEKRSPGHFEGWRGLVDS